MEGLEPVDTYITLARAGQISGLSPETLRKQAHPRKGQPPRLRTVRLGHDRLTTRRWLHEYLMGRDERNQHAAPLPDDYVPPEVPHG
jgi:hypothetical protein